MKLKLHTSTAVQHSLHELHDSVKRGKHVKVPRDALINLLMDHANLVHRVGLSEIEEPVS